MNYINKKISKNPTFIKVNCEKIRTDTDSYKIIYNRVPETDFRLNVSSLGCFTIDTNPVKLKENDSIVYNFYFAENDAPIIDCEH